MASTILSNKCLCCNKIIAENENVYYLRPVKTTRIPYGGYQFKTITDNDVRIMYVPHGKPKGLVCFSCIEYLFDTSEEYSGTKYYEDD